MMEWRGRKDSVKMRMSSLVMVAAAAMTALSASAEAKFGMVDMVLLVRNHPSYDANKELLTSTDKDFQKKLGTIKDEGEKLQSEGKQLAEQLRNPMLADKAKGDIEKQLMDIQQKLVAIEQRYRSEAMRCRQDLQDLEGRLLKTTTDNLRKRIAKFAEEKGYDVVFDKQAVPYAKSAYDVTDQMLLAMGVDPKEAKGRDEGK